MFYPAGGYSGLYFFPSVALVPPSEISDLDVEIPMQVVTGGLTRPVTIVQYATIPMALVPRVTLPMTRMLSDLVEIPMHLPTRALLPLSAIGADLPMHVVTGGLTRPATVARAATIPMAIAPTVTVPMIRGLAEAVEIPMQIRTRATLERG